MGANTRQGFLATPDIIGWFTIAGRVLPVPTSSRTNLAPTSITLSSRSVARTTSSRDTNLIGPISIRIRPVRPASSTRGTRNPTPPIDKFVRYTRSVGSITGHSPSTFAGGSKNSVAFATIVCLTDARFSTPAAGAAACATLTPADAAATAATAGRSTVDLRGGSTAVAVVL